MDGYTPHPSELTNVTLVSLLVASTNTTDAPSKPYPVFVGYISAIVAVLLYGSNFVPVKKYYTGDGMFFQWILCSAILLSGIVMQIIQNSTFYPFVMVGGAVWATGNICVVPIFKTIGMGLGMSIWGSIALVTGWACGKFGLFDTDKADISHPTMNYIGVALSFLSVFIFSSVKNEVSGTTDMEVIIPQDEEPLLGQQRSSINENNRTSVIASSGSGADDVLVFNAENRIEKSGSFSESDDEDEKDDETFLDHLSPMRKRIVGTVLSVGSGIMYGVNFMPANYIQDNGHHSKNGLNYVFAQFCGTYLASSVYFLLYCIVKKNKPRVYPRVIVPGIISGILWSIATICWFIANSELSQAVSFPIVAAGPSGIASLFWGVFIFHEIKGKRNILTLLLAFTVCATGAIVAGFSL